MRYLNLVFLISILSTSCSKARLAIDDSLRGDSKEITVTETPGPFGGGQLVFGSFKVTDIDSSFFNKKGASTSVMGISAGASSINQDLKFKFSGAGTYNVTCKRTGSVKKVSVASEANYEFNCTANSKGKKTMVLKVTTEASGAFVNFTALPWTGGAKGKKFKLAITSTREKAGGGEFYSNTGFLFKKGEISVAAAEMSTQWSFWHQKKMSKRDLDLTALAGAALMLNQKYGTQ